MRQDFEFAICNLQFAICNVGSAIHLRLTRSPFDCKLQNANCKLQIGCLQCAIAFLVFTSPLLAADPPRSEAADPAEIERLVKEIEPSPLPATLLRSDGPKVDLVRQPYDAATMKPYLADRLSPVDILAEPAKHPLAAAAVEAGERLRKLAKSGPAKLQIEFRAPLNPGLKKQVQQMQRVPARMLAELDEIAELLEQTAQNRKAESSPRWRAHFDLLQARVNLWRVAIHEYDLMLGRIRKDELPELDAGKGENGWRLAPAEKVQSSADVRALAKEAAKQLAKVEMDLHGTPWAELAKRDQALKPGLEWQPAKLPPVGKK